MADNMAPTLIIQNSIPVRYDPRVVVKPCEPDRVPHLPGDILYLIAQALPQPKQVFNLALASKGIWHHLKPALYECEVTYEARLAHKYGGRSTASIDKYYRSYRQRLARYIDYSSDIDDDSDYYGLSDSEPESENGSYSDADDNSTGEHKNEKGDAERRWAAEHSYQAKERRSTRRCNYDPCDLCIGRIDVENRKFESQIPDVREQFRIAGAMTALHWASIQGTSALPVARDVIRAALTHQPCYINGLGLIERRYQLRTGGSRCSPQLFADHPPPLFLAVANGNVELFQALVHAGADTSLSLGRINFWDGRDAMTCSKIHWQCLKPLSMFATTGCLFDYQMDDEEEMDWDLDEDWDIHLAENPNFPGCQTIGHVAVQFEQTEILQMLLWNGLDVQHGSQSLLHSAVLQGNLAAVKVLLTHNSRFVHSRYKGITPMHLVSFMENKAGVDVPQEQLESIISSLLEHGASLQARAEWYRPSSKYSIVGDTPLDAAFERLNSIKIKYDQEHRIITALRAANLLIDLGSSWLTPLSRDIYRFLDLSLRKTILLVESEYLGDYELWNSRLDSIRYRSIRKVWGRTCKDLIRQASEALSRGVDSDYKKAIQEMLHVAFRHLVDQVDRKWQQEGTVGWRALEAVGSLLLSTGMKPCGTTMRAWKRILERDYEVPHRKVKLIQDCEELDGDKSEWAFLLEGVNFAKSEAHFPTGEHRHYEPFSIAPASHLFG